MFMQLYKYNVIIIKIDSITYFKSISNDKYFLAISKAVNRGCCSNNRPPLESFMKYSNIRSGFHTRNLALLCKVT